MAETKDIGVDAIASGKKNMTVQSSHNIETGFVGFFDILGYGSLLSCGITEETKRVVCLLKALPETFRKAHSEFLGLRHLNGHDDFKLAVDQIQCLVVADSILLTAAYVGASNPGMKCEQAYAFLSAACRLQRQMFEDGLPLRGAIAFGGFIIAGNVFVGRPIYDAHRLEQSLDLAACALHESAIQEWKSISGRQENSELDEELKWFCVRYTAPTKKGHIDTLCLNLAWPTISDELYRLRDVRQYVLQKFAANNKQVGGQEKDKLDNTTAFLEFLRKKYPLLFDRLPLPQIP